MQSVIIIDDEEDARLLIRQHLMAYTGFHIVGECGNGPDAVEYINQLRPDIVFLDIHIPVLDGFQVISQLAYAPQIIITTCYDKYALKAFEMDVIDYLLKPFSPERFAVAISKISHAYIP
jgi:two-component system, LytTR family, response regulator